MNPITSQLVRGALIALAVSSAIPCSQQPTFSAPGDITAQHTQPSEVRGMWVVRTSITTPASITQVIAQAKSHHFNTLFVQVRGRGDAFYNSTLEPRSEELANQPLSFDPLAETIRQAHAVGIQVHAWINTCYVWGSPKRPLSPEHVVNAHPEWLDRDAAGNCRMTNAAECEGAFLSPANLDARKHIHDVFLEIAHNYDIDGIHFDYIRYPSTTYDYSFASLSRFRDAIRPKLSTEMAAKLDAKRLHDRLAYVHMFPSEFADFRRAQVTEMVSQISHDIKADKPWVVISAAVFADSKDAYVNRGQDWKTWLRQGYVDAVVPMAYGVDTAKVAAQIADAVSCARESHRYVYAGIGSWHIPAASTIAKIAASRSLGAQGEVLFSYGGMTHDGATTAYLDKVASSCYSQLASVPRMTWMPERPATPTVTASGSGEDRQGG